MGVVSKVYSSSSRRAPINKQAAVGYRIQGADFDSVQYAPRTIHGVVPH